MTIYDCDAVRDLIPVFMRAEALSHEEAGIGRHLEACATCGREAAIVRLLQQIEEPVPAGLEARVLAAVDSMPGRRASWPVPARLAMAATLAAAMIGGALAVNSFTGPDVDSEPMLMAEFEVPSATLLGWVLEDDPMLHGGASLDELTVQELEILLAELES